MQYLKCSICSLLQKSIWICLWVTREQIIWHNFLCILWTPRDSLVPVTFSLWWFVIVCSWLIGFVRHFHVVSSPQRICYCCRCDITIELEFNFIFDEKFQVFHTLIVIGFVSMLVDWICLLLFNIYKAIRMIDGSMYGMSTHHHHYVEVFFLFAMYTRRSNNQVC